MLTYSSPLTCCSHCIHLTYLYIPRPRYTCTCFRDCISLLLRCWTAFVVSVLKLWAMTKTLTLKPSNLTKWLARQQAAFRCLRSLCRCFPSFCRGLFHVRLCDLYIMLLRPASTQPAPTFHLLRSSVKCRQSSEMHLCSSYRAAFGMAGSSSLLY